MPGPNLAIVTSHPIQYYAPVFRALTSLGTVNVRVFYTWSQVSNGGIFDRDFGTELKWDIPLLAGYAHQFVQNTSRRPGTDHFYGLKNPTLISEVESWHADALLVYGWNAHSHLQALRHFKGRIPVFFRGDSTLLDRRSSWRTALRRAFLRWVYSNVDVAIAVGSNNRDYFAWAGVPPDRIAIAPHSVDTGRFAADAEQQQQRAEEWRRTLGIAPEAVVFLFAGKLQEKKSPGLLLAAFQALDDKSHLVFAGSGELESQLKSQAGTRRNVHFLSFQNQSAMPLVYRLGDVFVLPSQGPGETWGLALNEAIASGRPVVASSKVGGARDLIQAGVNGWTFESGDQQGLQGILRRAIGLGRPRLQSMGAAAHGLSDSWSTQECAQRIAAVVLKTVGANRP
jgi:glycosyltransferase involved in cell wall biosynthesis